VHSRVCGWGNFLHYLFADLDVLSSAYTSYKKFSVYHLKRVFVGLLWAYLAPRKSFDILALYKSDYYIKM